MECRSDFYFIFLEVPYLDEYVFEAFEDDPHSFKAMKKSKLIIKVEENIFNVIPLLLYRLLMVLVKIHWLVY